jgi:hypothetical protein
MGILESWIRVTALNMVPSPPIENKKSIPAPSLFSSSK